VLKYLYDGGKANPNYYYTWGWSIQALIAYAVGVALPLPGFIGSSGAHVSHTATNMGSCLSFVVSIAYLSVCYVWPTQNQKALKKMNLKLEELAREEFVYTGHVINGESVDDENR
jgi:NCS1 family nucleobase:cation symporter-1